MTSNAAHQPQHRQDGSHYYLWDSRLVIFVNEDLFNPQAWKDAGRMSGQASGRGAAYFVRPDEGATAWVLRHSRRGGIIANISDDAYLWLGQSRCRVFREFRLLAELKKLGLPVPEPVAARVYRHGTTYKGDLITVQVPDARPLADWLMDMPLDAVYWQSIGTTIARFHDAGVYHHDLNARNILIGPNGTATLIDFDKSSIRKPGRWREQNLARLRRSLDKITSQQPALNFSEPDWQALLSGYQRH